MSRNRADRRIHQGPCRIRHAARRTFAETTRRIAHRGITRGGVAPHGFRLCFDLVPVEVVSTDDGAARNRDERKDHRANHLETTHAGKRRTVRRGGRHQECRRTGVRRGQDKVGP